MLIIRQEYLKSKLLGLKNRNPTFRKKSQGSSSGRISKAETEAVFEVKEPVQQVADYGKVVDVPMFVT